MKLVPEYSSSMNCQLQQVQCFCCIKKAYDVVFYLLTCFQMDCL